MAGSDASSDHIIATLLDMGFELSSALQAVEAAGSCLDSAVDFIVNRSRLEQHSAQGRIASDDDHCSTSQTCPPGKNDTRVHNSRRLKQSSISDHLSSLRRPTTSSLIRLTENGHTQTGSSKVSRPLESNLAPYPLSGRIRATPSESSRSDEVLGFQTSNVQHWEKEACDILLQKFGFSSLKNFQRKTIEAWMGHGDCLVLAATGSGKSLCFQLPAFLSQKVVVVISPLISLMRDQCLKLTKHGVSACFLGSGQPDSSIENKAMHGVYDLVYVCPETVLRLVGPLQRLAESRGIALFAIDEAHCVSKWGHDFRPDYRRLSVLRDTFNACKMKCLDFDIPLMAMTATATVPVRKDIIQSLLMSEETQIIVTSLFRPNLRFSVKHSRTSSTSYPRDFSELIESYAVGRKNNGRLQTPSRDSTSDYLHSWNAQGTDAEHPISEHVGFNECSSVSSSSEEHSVEDDGLFASSEQMTVEFLEDDLEIEVFDNLDGKRHAQSIHSGTVVKLSHKMHWPSEPGTTIVYVPTRKETEKISGFLCKCGVKAAAYHALLPKSHLRRVHEEFHCGKIQVVVATVAFGMGIDKSDVRKIIHYGWPQSLEAYYQEAGRAGRDGKMSDCVLYANLARAPTLLPSRRNEEQTRHAYAMLHDCFRYATNTASCRAKILVKYFAEDFLQEKCGLCDVCLNGQPERQDYQEEAKVFMQVLAAHYENIDDEHHIDFRMILSGIRERYEKYSSSERSWWQGLARILMDNGFIKERDSVIRVDVKFPEPTAMGMQFLRSDDEKPLYAYPEADMIISRGEWKPFSSFSEWGQGWADPEIRRQRLRRMGSSTGKRKSRSRRWRADVSTVRGRISAKLSKQKTK